MYEVEDDYEFMDDESVSNANFTIMFTNEDTYYQDILIKNFFGDEVKDTKMMLNDGLLWDVFFIYLFYFTILESRRLRHYRI